MTATTTNRVTTWDQFARQWHGPLNFLLGGECLPFQYEFPPLDRIVDEIRQAEGAQIGSGQVGNRLLKDDYSAHFRGLPIDKAMDSSFSLAHFKLSRFDVPGGLLPGFKEGVLDPWQKALAGAGFTWDRCYPIIFISGKRCATNYHMDFSHVMAWQIYGVKQFHGLKDPDKWAPKNVRLNYKAFDFVKPTTQTEADDLCHVMRPGDGLWNILLTPHWVDATDEVAMSVNISHGGLRLKGKLSPNEDELFEYRRQNPEGAPKAVSGTY